MTTGTSSDPSAAHLPSIASPPRQALAAHPYLQARGADVGASTEEEGTSSSSRSNGPGEFRRAEALPVRKGNVRQPPPCRRRARGGRTGSWCHSYAVSHQLFTEFESSHSHSIRNSSFPRHPPLPRRPHPYKERGTLPSRWRHSALLKPEKESQKGGGGRRQTRHTHRLHKNPFDPHPARLQSACYASRWKN